MFLALTEVENPQKSGSSFLNPHLGVRHRQPNDKNQLNPIINLADERPDVNSTSVLGVIESVNMIEADDQHGVENNEKCAEIPGLRSIERAIEKSLAMTLKRIPVARSGGSESIVVAREWVDDSMGNSEHGKTTKLKENLNSNKARPDSTVIEGDFEVENYQQNDLQGGREEIEIIIRKGSHVDCVGEISEGAGSVSGNRVQILQKTPKSWTLRDLMVLQDNDVDVTSFQSATAVDNSQARNFCLNASPGIVYQNSTEEGILSYFFVFYK